MISQAFKDHVRTLSTALASEGYFLDVYALLNVADATFVDVTVPDYSTHEGRVLAALSSPVVIQYMSEQKKINAIKALRSITSSGLKEAKDAVEDPRVYEVSGYTPPVY